MAAVAQNPPQNEAPKSTSHEQSSQDKQPDSPITPLPVTKDDINLQSKTSEKCHKCVCGEPSKTDWWARVTNLFVALGTWALVIIGGIASCAAIKTLRTLARQTAASVLAAEAAQVSADAALLNAQAVINSERAWIEGELIEETFPAKRSFLKITNHGKTPAKIMGFEVRYGCLADEPFSIGKLAKKETWNTNFLLGTQKTWDASNSWQGGANILRFDFGAMFEGCGDGKATEARGALYVLIRYVDLIAQPPKDRKTSFVYYYRPLFGSLEKISVYDEYT